MKLAFLTIAVAAALVTLWTDGSRAAEVPLDGSITNGVVQENDAGQGQMTSSAETGSPTSGFRAPRSKGFGRRHHLRGGFRGGFGYPGFYAPSYGLGIGYAGVYGGPLSWGYWGY